MKPFLLFLFLLSWCPIRVDAQRVAATVVDAEDGSPLTFAAVAVKGRLEGQYTDILGRFIFYDVVPTEELIFSALGYEDRKIRVGALPDTVKMVPLAMELPAVEVERSGRMRRGALGNLRASGNWGFSAPKGFTIVRYLPGRRRPGWLRSVIIKFNNNKDCGGLFRLRLFRASVAGKERSPGSNLLDRTVEVYVSAGQELLEVDLREEDIFLPRAGSFLGLEFLRPDEGCPTNNSGQKNGPNLALGIESNRTSTYLRYPGDEWGFWHSYFEEEAWEEYFPRGVKTLHLQIKVEVGYFKER